MEIGRSNYFEQLPYETQIKAMAGALQERATYDATTGNITWHEYVLQDGRRYRSTYTRTTDGSGNTVVTASRRELVT